MEQPSLGKRISELRKAKGLTQQELAEQCKVSARTMQRIENGVVIPRVYTIRAIFAALGCDFPEKDRSSMMIHFERVYNYLKDLFNLKINTMKKVSILTVFALAVGFGLFVLCFDSKAQKMGNESYLPSRGVVYQIPMDLGGIFISNVKDTAIYRFGNYLIQEYNKQIFLDREFVGLVEEGDTVIFNKGTFFKKAELEFRRVEYQKILALEGITFISSKHHLPFTLKIRDGGEMRWGSKNDNLFAKENQIILDKENQMFLNDVYQGNVFANDTIVLKSNGTLIIKSANRIEN